MIKHSVHSRLFGAEASFYSGRELGFTMIELLISMSIATVVAMSGFVLFSASNWTYQVQENVGEAQQNVRIAMDRVARDIRMSGFGRPNKSTKIFDLDSAITVSDATGYDGSDKITILGIGYEEGDIVGTNSKTQNFICYSSTNKSSPDWKDGKILNQTTFRVYSTRRYISIDGVFYAELDTARDSSSIGSTDCNSANRMKLPLGSPGILKGSFTTGNKVYIIQAIEYSIATDIKGCSADNPCLVSNDFTSLRGAGRQLLAENIEDIQFAYGLDDGEGKVEYAATYEAASFKNALVATDDADDIRAVRVTLAARTRHKDSKGAVFKRPAIENHAESAGDNYRRRLLTKIVKVRN